LRGESKQERCYGVLIRASSGQQKKWCGDRSALVSFEGGRTPKQKKEKSRALSPHRKQTPPDTFATINAFALL
jgi:hypothetical protein